MPVGVIGRPVGSAVQVDSTTNEIRILPLNIVDCFRPRARAAADKSARKRTPCAMGDGEEVMVDGTRGEVTRC